MLPSQYFQDCSFPSSIGSDEEATIAGEEGEGEVLDQWFGAGRRMAVDSWVCEFEVVDHHRCFFSLHAHFLILVILKMEIYIYKSGLEQGLAGIETRQT